MTDKVESVAGEQSSTLLSPGMQLRAARERAGWTAERLAAELCLPISRLHALEQDDHASFGGVVFVRGYLRRAAILLGIPPQELISAYESCYGTPRPEEILPALTPGAPPPRVIPGWAGSLAGILLVAVAIGGTWWLMGPDPDGAAPATPTARPAAGLEFTPPEEPRVALHEQAPELPVAVSGDARATNLPEESAPERVSELTPESSPEPPRTERVVAEIPEPAAPAPGTAELRFEFSEDCWLEVHDAEDRRLAYRLYRAGEVARLRGTAPLSVFLGNAEGVRLTVDDAPIALRAARTDGTARLTVGGGAG